MNAMLEKEVCRLWALPAIMDKPEADTWFNVGLTVLKMAYHAYAHAMLDTAEDLMILSLICRTHAGVI